MSRRPHKNDICIGEDLWISFGDLNNGQERAIELDPILAPVKPFLDRLETHCVAGCCGIDAYGLYPDDIKSAISTLNRKEREQLVSILVEVQREIECAHADTVVSTRMNQYFRKVVFLELLDHLRSVIEGERLE